MNMFEKASRLGLRIKTSVGGVTVEDLWDLHLTSLNEIAKGLNKALKEKAEEDFLSDTPKEDETLRLKFDIVLHILNTKKAEAEERANEAKKAADKEFLLKLLEKKRIEGMENMSEEDLLEKIKELG